MKEKRKKRIIRTIEGQEIRTLTTYKRFRKRLIKEGIEFYVFDRKNKRYQESAEAVIEPEEERRVKVPERRIRRSATLNLRSVYEPYAISIRAVTINPDITNEGLRIVVEELYGNFKEANETFISGEYKHEIGYEEAVLAPNEDRSLNDGRIYYEIQVRKEPKISGIY